MPLSGSSTKLAAAIKKAGQQLNSTSKLPMQAHHLLASSVVIALDTKFYKLGKKGKKKRFAHASGYDLNGAPNGINLPIRFGHQAKLKLVRHRGRHGPPYFKEIETLLEPLYQDVLDNGKDMCGADGAAFKLNFAAKEKNVRGRITGTNPSLWLYEKWSEKLWNADYMDEGATVGKLRSPYGIVDDAAAGLEWEQKMKPIKRRHTMTGPGKKTAVLNAVWYASRGYPTPGWP